MMIRLILVAMLLPCLAFSQTVGSVSGTVFTGETLTIGGTGFGTKSPAAPTIWETWEEFGVHRTPVEQFQPEYLAHNNYVGNVYTSDDSHSGTFSVGTNVAMTDTIFSSTDYKPRSFLGSYIYYDPTDTIFLSYWWSTEAVEVGPVLEFDSVNIKLARIISSDIPGTPNYYQGGTIGLSSLFPGISATTGPTLHIQNNVGGDADVSFNIKYNEWQRIDYSGWLGDVDQSNGWAYVEAVNGASHLESNWPFMVGSTWSWDTLWLGPVMTNIDYLRTGEFVPTSMSMYMDDIYLDNTLARVELGDNIVFDSCTHREMQIPITWTDTEITLTANTGSFASSEEAYIFVVDADGSVSAGSAVTIGLAAVGLPGITAAPTNLTVTGGN